ncbi:MAG: hypothetical protein LBT81_05765 [Helicobacteraceae bacterium]|jgi:hypothetical protein|nr:hypothetical protein [Helicobacteraceae bacterium]
MPVPNLSDYDEKLLSAFVAKPDKMPFLPRSVPSGYALWRSKTMLEMVVVSVFRQRFLSALPQGLYGGGGRC